MPSREVVITGMGAICALGDRPDRIHQALRAGRVGFGTPTLFPAEIAPGHEVAELWDFAPQAYLGDRNIRPLDRTGRLAAVGVELALADSGWSLEKRCEQQVGLIVGTMFCSARTIGEFDRRAQLVGVEYASPLDFSNTVLNAAAGQVAIWHRLLGVNSTIAAGATSGLHAIGYAAQLIRAGRASALVAGGAEEICFESFYGFLRAGRLALPIDGRPGCAVPFDARRTGSALGEGAAFLVLEAEDVSRARGARVLGRVVGFAAGYDPSAHAGDRGRGRPQTLARVIQRALTDARVSAAEIGAVAVSASGNPALDVLEASAVRASIGAATPVTAIKSMIGDTLGASGALQSAVLVESLRTARLPGIAGLERLDPAIDLAVTPLAQAIRAAYALATAIAPEGNCCALVLGAP